MIPHYGILTLREIGRIHDASLAILERVGFKVHHEGILARLAEAGARVDQGSGIARIGEQMVADAIASAGKQYTLYGRDGSRTARFGHGDIVALSSPGQYSWVDWRSWRRSAPTTNELLQAITVGDALEHIDIVGAMTQPIDVPEPIRDIYLTAELVKRTAKPTRVWIKNGKTARYILEIYRIVAGGSEAMRQRPPIEAFVEPISPLQMPRTGMEILMEFTAAGLPVSYGPMVQAGATGPTTLAGTMAQENAEILAALVITQLLRPGTPIMYGGIPHTMDMRRAHICFGAPEQGLLSVAMAQVGHHYGFPVYVNAGLGDSKVVDAQMGYEHGMTFLMGTLAGADLLGHMGTSGADQGGSLLQLMADNEMIAYVKRIRRGVSAEVEDLALEIIEEVGPGGNYLGLPHTARHFRRELWIPAHLWDRDVWEVWEASGATTMEDRLAARLEEILRTHQAQPIEEDLAREIDRVVAAASRDLAATPPQAASPGGP